MILLQLTVYVEAYVQSSDNRMDNCITYSIGSDRNSISVSCDN